MYMMGRRDHVWAILYFDQFDMAVIVQRKDARHDFVASAVCFCGERESESR